MKCNSFSAPDSATLSHFKPAAIFPSDAADADLFFYPSDPTKNLIRRIFVFPPPLYTREEKKTFGKSWDSAQILFQVMLRVICGL